MKNLIIDMSQGGAVRVAMLLYLLGIGFPKIISYRSLTIRSTINMIKKIIISWDKCQRFTLSQIKYPIISLYKIRFSEELGDFP